MEAFKGTFQEYLEQIEPDAMTEILNRPDPWLVRAVMKVYDALLIIPAWFWENNPTRKGLEAGISKLEAEVQLYGRYLRARYPETMAEADRNFEAKFRRYFVDS